MAATEAKTTLTVPVKIIGAIGLLCSTVPVKTCWESGEFVQSAHPVVQLMCAFGQVDRSKKQVAKWFGQSMLVLAAVLQGVHYLKTK